MNHVAPSISPLAYIHPEAVIGENCEIGPFCYIDKNVVIGKGNRLMNSVTLLDGTRMGDENVVFPGAVIGAIPQDLKYSFPPSHMFISLPIIQGGLTSIVYLQSTNLIHLKY